MKSRTAKIIQGIKEDKIFGGKERVEKFIVEAGKFAIIVLAIIGLLTILQRMGYI